MVIMSDYQSLNDMIRQLADAQAAAQRAALNKVQPPTKLPVFKPLQKPSPIKLKPLPQVGLAGALVKAQQQTPPAQLFFRRKPTFVSFDWENDRRYKHLLQALDKNTRFDFKFKDASSSEINSNDVARVKAALTAKINTATHFLCIAGEFANQLHADAAVIGYINWLNFEAHQAVVAKKKIVVVRLQPHYLFPHELEGAQGILVEGFKPAEILKALNEVK
jgi:hypothetical protein